MAFSIMFLKNTGVGVDFNMQVRAFHNTMLGSMMYSVENTFLVDPGDYKPVCGKCRYILLTHAHFDHIYGLNKAFRQNPDSKICTNAAGREMLLNSKKNLSFYHESPFVFEHPEAILEIPDRGIIQAGNLSAQAIYTPGHNPSCITWVVGDCVFSGDSLIPGIKTVTNLPKSDKTAAAASEELIRNLMSDRHLFPGHSV